MSDESENKILLSQIFEMVNAKKEEMPQKKKRVVSDEQKARAIENLRKGRETSLANRRAKKEQKVKEKQVKNVVLPVIQEEEKPAPPIEVPKPVVPKPVVPKPVVPKPVVPKPKLVEPIEVSKPKPVAVQVPKPKPVEVIREQPTIMSLRKMNLW